MQLSDAGVYTCQVHNFPDVDGQSEANVIVKVLGKFCSLQRESLTAVRLFTPIGHYFK